MWVDVMSRRNDTMRGRKRTETGRGDRASMEGRSKTGGMRRRRRQHQVRREWESAVVPAGACEENEASFRAVSDAWFLAAQPRRDDSVEPRKRSALASGGRLIAPAIHLGMDTRAYLRTSTGGRAMFVAIVGVLQRPSCDR